jgi:type III restriction enzyme
VADGQVTEQNPIINDPYVEPTRHWTFGEGAPAIEEGRRVSGYLPPATSGELDVTADVVPLDLVNDLRDRVRRWRDESYPGATAITRDLFDRWFDDEREPGMRPFFAQQEAVETAVFLTEAPSDRRVGIDVPRTEAYERLAVKMATGTGKTLVMAMLIAWSGLNKVANAQDTRFADAVLIVAPNLTVKQRLEELEPEHEHNAYRAFDLVPPNLSPLLSQVKVQVVNWHKLAPATDPKRSVQRLGEESPAAFCKRVLEVDGKLGRKRRILVLNDEAHHAYRRAPGARVRRDERDDVERATVWIDGLGRIHHDREILRCIDLSATPMFVPGSGHDPWTPFPWIVSDFALVDAIEAGLVKVPRIPVDDNAGAAVPKYRELWKYVKANLPKAGDDADGGHPLTDYLAGADGALKQLANEWLETFERWQDGGRRIPPVMIVICHDTKMAELLEIYIAQKGRVIAELANCDGATRTVRIDSRLLADAEARDEAETASAASERLRTLVATVGKEGRPGEQVRCLISVQMLSEGWDARNVTQILGLRAFQSQLLCEQVVGRGLRRSSYDDLATPEYVDVYGVPFQMLPFAKSGAGTVTPPPRLTSVVALRDRAQLEIRFPRVVSIVPDVRRTLGIDWDSIVRLPVRAEQDPTRTTVDIEQMRGLAKDEQDRERVWQSYRRQRLCFDVAARVIRGQESPETLFPQAAQAVERFVETKVELAPGVEEGELDTSSTRPRSPSGSRPRCVRAPTTRAACSPSSTSTSRKARPPTSRSRRRRPIRSRRRSRTSTSSSAIRSWSDTSHASSKPTSSSSRTRRTTICSARSPTDTWGRRGGTCPTSSSSSPNASSS